MAQARKQERSAVDASTPPHGRIVVRSGRGLEARHGTVGEVTEVVVSRDRFRRISGKRRMIGKLLADYADTLAQAEREGKAATITLQVSPDGAVALVDAIAGGDALDAALAAARARGQGKAATILKGADMMTAREFGALIGASHETVNTKRKTGEVLGLEAATRGVRYPRWQVTEAGLPLPGLAALSTVLGQRPWTVYRFLRTVHAELGGRTALEALRAGDVEAVLGAAGNQAVGAFA